MKRSPALSDRLVIMSWRSIPRSKGTAERFTVSVRGGRCILNGTRDAVVIASTLRQR